VDGPWGTISLEPGGQVEWSSRPRATLALLRADLDDHVAAMRGIGSELGIRWLPEAVDPRLPLERMVWMPKARYNIMRPFLGARGRLAHRMMTQTASIQCAFDFADPQDWRRKFKAAALLAPVATALFANSSRVDGGDSGWRSYRQAIWRETDPARCGLPEIVFTPGFGIESWLDWVLQVPTIFRHRARGLVPAGGVPFVELLELGGCEAIRNEDWETHISTVFTEVRCYTYVEVRSADAQPDEHAFAVPSFWTGLLYHDEALSAALELGRPLDHAGRWAAAMRDAARRGLDGEAAGRSLRELAVAALAHSIAGLRGDAACAAPDDALALEAFAAARGVEPRS
jgi:glutamate--cysteine ligase